MGQICLGPVPGKQPLMRIQSVIPAGMQDGSVRRPSRHTYSLLIIINVHTFLICRLQILYNTWDTHLQNMANAYHLEHSLLQEEISQQKLKLC